MKDYSGRREEIYGPLRSEGIFTWDKLYGKEYALATPYTVDKQEIDLLRGATESLGRIFSKTVATIQKSGKELLAELALPEATMEAVRVGVLPDTATLIGRFDFVRTSSGWKMLEFNSDTPGGVVEAFYVNGAVCDYYRVANPNAGFGDDLAAAFRRIVNKYKDLGYGIDNIVFSALDWHEEDAGTTRYLLKQSGLDAHFVALKDMRVLDDSLCAPVNGRLTPVDVWYRLHPLGLLAEDREDGYPTGEHVLSLIARRKLAVINPPGALIAQTKALQALIWNLHEAGGYFDAEEDRVIHTYMLPTYFENRFHGHCSYVVKPALGREGGGITIYDRDGRQLARDQEQYYWEQLMIYQQYREVERVGLETLDGLCEGRLIWGSFLIDGRSSAVIARAGGYITDDLAYFVPVCMEG